jgi:hypothetical protein
VLFSFYTIRMMNMGKNNTIANIKRRWLGAAPTVCDITKEPITDCFIDGATKMGPWACMTPKSHAIHGRGLGVGKGQKYELQGPVMHGSPVWLKTEG